MPEGIFHFVQTLASLNQCRSRALWWNAVFWNRSVQNRPRYTWYNYTNKSSHPGLLTRNRGWQRNTCGVCVNCSLWVQRAHYWPCSKMWIFITSNETGIILVDHLRFSLAFWITLFTKCCCFSYWNVVVAVVFRRWFLTVESINSHTF